jgi:glutamate/tyrosine decarboxylase-like PLP-dependent enzyme
MQRPEWKPLLERTCVLATGWLDGLADRPVTPREDATALFAAADMPVPPRGSEPVQVVEELARLVEPGLTAMPSGRFYGWVIGGGVPAAVAADWLTTVWDQNAGSAEGTPAAAVIEQVALRWVAELLEVPATSGVLVTGAQMGSFVGLAAARSEVLRAVAWDVEEDGLTGAPRVRVIVGAERHNTIDKALRLLGFGGKQLETIEADGEGRMRAEALARALATSTGPTIVCAQAGNVNGGGFDPLVEIGAAVAEARRRGTPIWLHLDGAFGLWARVAPARRALARGAELADSWSTDGHKWLNTPYDCGIALTRHADAHRRALRGGAAYLPDHHPVVRQPFDHAPELSRRARGFVLWAALRQLGRAGVAELVERTCAHAGRIAAGLAAIDGVEVMNEVALNQIVVRFLDPAGRDDDAHTRAVLARVLAGGVCYPSITTWRGRVAIRISVSNWATDDEDVARTVEALAAAHVLM